MASSELVCWYLQFSHSSMYIYREVFFYLIDSLRSQIEDWVGLQLLPSVPLVGHLSGFTVL